MLEKLVEGQPIQSGDLSITPISRAFQIQVPGFEGGLVWNRPEGVRVDVFGQESRFLPVRDPTRLIVWSILGAGVLGGLAFLLFSRRSR